MKKLLLAAGLATPIAFAACSTAQQQTTTTVATTFQARVEQACAVVQPELNNLAALASNGNSLLASQASALAALATDSMAVCQATTGVDTASVQSLVNTSIPAALTIVNDLPLDDQARLAVQAGLIVFQTALSAALAASPTAPASGTSTKIALRL
ncbi:hypothetical protein DF122_21015 [Burkholderia pseudomallei]|uniref:hypothetical protein n=1 Tax=Burkholderia pseudomallei TaxID=28450 RepID=UPI000F4E2F49|nr:hypothetical protein [Burkholderia pseudomallei]RSK62200.1 hypothetical protein DF122_21015 [Burkholderia pseudomallei]